MVLLHKAVHIFSTSTLVLAFKSVSNKRAEPLLLFVLAHITRSCCICLTWICNRGYGTWNWGGLGDNEDGPHSLSCSYQSVMCVLVLRFYLLFIYLLGLTRDQNQNQAKCSYRKEKINFLCHNYKILKSYTVVGFSEREVYLHTKEATPYSEKQW